MNIRLQSILFIVPIFLGIALAGAWLRLTAQEQELVWGLSEASGSTAGSVAAWLGNDSWRSAASTPATKAALAKALDTGLSRRLFVLSLESRELLFDLSKEPVAGKPPLDEEQFRAASGGATATSQIVNDGRGHDVIVSLSPIVDTDGKVVALAGTETLADEVRVKREEFMRGAVWLSGGVTLLGFLVALFLSSVIRARIRLLTRAAVRLASGDYDQRLETGLIHEVSELSNTFNTLASVLGDVVLKTRRALVVAEHVRNEDALVAIYVKEAFPAIRREGSTQILAMPAHQSCAGDFFEVVDSPEETFVVVGRVHASRALQRVKEATAARELCRSLLPSVGPEATYREVSALFELQRWECLLIEKTSGRCTARRLESAGGEPVKAEMSEAMRPMLVHTLRPQAAELVTEHLRCLKNVPVSDLADEVSSMLRHEKQGAIAIVG